MLRFVVAQNYVTRFPSTSQIRFIRNLMSWVCEIGYSSYKGILKDKTQTTFYRLRIENIIKRGEDTLSGYKNPTSKNEYIPEKLFHWAYKKIFTKKLFMV